MKCRKPETVGTHLIGQPVITRGVDLMRPREMPGGEAHMVRPFRSRRIRDA